MKITKILTLVLLVSVISFSSCQKEGPVGKDGIAGKDGIDGTDGIDGKDGKDGIDGTDGVDGTDGKDGIDGNDGKDGKDGTAQLKIFNFSVAQANWTNIGTPNQAGAFTYFDYNNPLITSKMIDSGMVMVYQILPSGITPLPRTSYTASGIIINNYYEASAGKIHLRLIANDWGQYALSGTTSFRVVIIPATAAQAPNIDWNNYDEVIRRFSAKD